MLKNTAAAYGSVTKIFHWLIFILLFGMIIFGFLLSNIPKDYQPVAYNIHKLIGLSILVLMILRLLWTLSNPKPAVPRDTPAWQQWAERFVHYSLYAVVLAMPISGWIGSSSAGKPPHLGDIAFGLPIEKNKELITTSFSVHEILAFVIIGLVCVHVGAALYHQFIKKDNVLQRMM
ncbi:MAG TPA: cytochrome b [Gammaproteobacteria bacterium]|jgi:cytochrome b561|nr:cytochrome b [Gammaproteobacteria bacterium]